MKLEKHSEGKRNVACHTRIVNRVPQFASRYLRTDRFHSLQHKHAKNDGPSNRDAQIDLILIDGLVLALSLSARG